MIFATKFHVGCPLYLWGSKDSQKIILVYEVLPETKPAEYLNEFLSHQLARRGKGNTVFLQAPDLKNGVEAITKVYYG